MKRRCQTTTTHVKHGVVQTVQQQTETAISTAHSCVIVVCAKSKHTTTSAGYKHVKDTKVNKCEPIYCSPDKISDAIAYCQQYEQKNSCKPTLQPQPGGLYFICA